jgi:hypothetical protein
MVHSLFLFSFGVFHRAARLSEFGVPDNFLEVLVLQPTRRRSQGRDTGIVSREIGKKGSNRYRKKTGECIQILGWNCSALHHPSVGAFERGPRTKSASCSLID